MSKCPDYGSEVDQIYCPFCQLYIMPSGEEERKTDNTQLVAMKKDEVKKLRERIEILEEALALASWEVEDKTSDCPGGYYSHSSIEFKGCSDSVCGKDSKSCWKQYFIEQAEKGR